MIIFVRLFLACAVSAAMPTSPQRQSLTPDSPQVRAETIRRRSRLNTPAGSHRQRRLTRCNGCPCFARNSSSNGPIRRATLRIVGLGDYDARINGQRLADTGINQPWSQYEKTIYYRDFDITRQVQPGVNCVGVMLTNSFWHNPVPPPGRYNKDGPQRLPPNRCCCVPRSSSKRPTALIMLARTPHGARRQGRSISRTSSPARISTRVGARPDGTVRALMTANGRPARGVGAGGKPGPAALAAHPVAGTFCGAVGQGNCAGRLSVQFPAELRRQLRVEIAGGKAGDRIRFQCGEHKNEQDRLFVPTSSDVI